MNISGRVLGWCLGALIFGPALASPNPDFRLLDAIQSRDTSAVPSLLKQHVDVNTAEGDGSTALVWAAHWNDLETVDLLIHAGANINATTHFGDTALWEACNNGRVAMVEKLTNAGADANAALLRTEETALMRCARTGNAEAVKILTDHGANVNAKEKQKEQTALMWAIEERHPEVARVLIEHGADIHAKSSSGFTPLLFAARQGDLDTAKLMIERGADVNELAPGGLNALLLAIDSGYEDFATFLLDKGANPNSTDPDGATPLHYALRKGLTLLRAGKRNGFNANQEYAFRPNMPGLVNALLEHGANPNARIVRSIKRFDSNERPMLGLAGATPFLLAAATGDMGIMRALLAKGADPNLATMDNTTPLMVAAGVGRWDERTRDEQKQALEAVKLLVSLGAPLNAASKDLVTNIPGGGMTALHGAAFNGADDIIQFLVEKGADLDAKDFFGMTPLSMAEGDPNGLMADFIEGPTHESTAALIRELVAATAKQGNSSRLTASAPN